MTICYIDHPNFNINLQLEVFENDIQYSSNTIMTVSVNSNSFCATTNMDIDIKQFIIFADDLSLLYSTLNGKAIIQEPYGEQFIEFSGDRTGHICVRGKLISSGRNGFTHKLSFENSIDQTYLPDFVKSLCAICSKYR